MGGLAERARRQRWWIVRVVALPAQLLVFAVISFALVHSVPGDPVLVLTGGQVTPEQYAVVEKSLGLDGSLLDQLLRYVGNIVTLDFGESLMTGRPVLTEFRDLLPATVELALMGLAGSIASSLVAAYLAVMRPANPVAKAVRGFARVAGGIPEFVVGVTAIFVFYATLRWAPAPLGRLSTGLAEPPRRTGFPLLDAVLAGDPAVVASMVGHLVLPVGTIVLAQSGVLIKLLIAAMEEAIDAAPTRFRIVSGASRRAVLLSIYRRALPATVTTCGTLFGYSIGGAVIVESLFGLAGMGHYLVDAVDTGDIVAMQGFLLVIAGLSLTVFLLVDLTNMLLDPRRRPGAMVEAAA